jgi:pantoate--beta-alanine ligase
MYPFTTGMRITYIRFVQKMDVYSKISAIREYKWAVQGVTWGLVPTMGALHRGHLSLIRRAKLENEKVGISIFINPIQFNDPNDLNTYPRDIERDLQILENEKVDLVWIPSPDIMYPQDYQTYVDVEQVTVSLEGASRPGHFRGVTTVVAKLFNVFQPDRAYFGEKDAQQLVAIRQMVKDLNFNLEIISCATIREEDGLAVSSRNNNLSPKGRKQAVCLFQSLSQAKQAIESGVRDSKHLRALMTKIIQQNKDCKIDYISFNNPDTLSEINKIEDRVLISLAVFIENVRLIDNMTI